MPQTSMDIGSSPDFANQGPPRVNKVDTGYSGMVDTLRVSLRRVVTEVRNRSSGRRGPHCLPTYLPLPYLVRCISPHAIWMPGHPVTSLQGNRIAHMEKCGFIWVYKVCMYMPIFGAKLFSKKSCSLLAACPSSHATFDRQLCQDVASPSWWEASGTHPDIADRTSVFCPLWIQPVGPGWFAFHRELGRDVPGN